MDIQNEKEILEIWVEEDEVEYYAEETKKMLEKELK